jgi:hypothetical protein
MLKKGPDLQCLSMLGQANICVSASNECDCDHEVKRVDHTMLMMTSTHIALQYRRAPFKSAPP